MGRDQPSQGLNRELTPNPDTPQPGSCHTWGLCLLQGQVSLIFRAPVFVLIPWDEIPHHVALTGVLGRSRKTRNKTRFHGTQESYWDARRPGRLISLASRALFSCFVHSGVRRVGDSGGWTKGRVHQTGAGPSPGQASGPVSGGSQVPPAGQRVAVRGFPW